MQEEEKIQEKEAPAQMMVEEEEEETNANNMPAQMQEDKEEEIQAKKGQQNPDSPTSKTTNSFAHLNMKLQTKMQNSFGTSFQDVNIHQNDNSASQMGALAYTQGNNVHFAPGQFNPNTQGGQELLGHELTHVVQQRQGRVQPTKQGKGLSINDNPSLENEADTMGKKAANGQQTDVAGKGNGLQKEDDPKYTYGHTKDKSVTDKKIKDYHDDNLSEIKTSVKKNKGDYMDELAILQNNGLAVFSAMRNGFNKQADAYKQAYNNVEIVLNDVSKERQSYAALMGVFITFVAGFAGAFTSGLMKSVMGNMKLTIGGIAAKDCIIDGLKDVLKDRIKAGGKTLTAPKKNNVVGKMDPLGFYMRGKEAIEAEEDWFNKYIAFLSNHKFELEGVFSPLEALDFLSYEFAEKLAGGYEAESRADTKELEKMIWKSWLKANGKKAVQTHSYISSSTGEKYTIPGKVLDHLKDELGISEKEAKKMVGPLKRSITGIY
jgi:hypothetical protein